jgi:hypothetical protein
VLDAFSRARLACIAYDRRYWATFLVGELMTKVSQTSLRSSPMEPEATMRGGRDGLIEEEKLLTKVQVRKPAPHEFVRVHSDPDYSWSPAGIAKISNEDRESYLLLAPDWSPKVGTRRYTLYLAVNRLGVPLIWPVRLPGPDGMHNPWHQKAAEAAELAKTRWVRIEPNPSLGTYDIFVVGGLPEPSWPDLSFAEIFHLAFQNRVIYGPERLRRVRMVAEALVPRWCRAKIEEAFDIHACGPEEDLLQFIKECRAQWDKLSLLDIAMPATCSGLAKFTTVPVARGRPQPPMCVAGAIAYNNQLETKRLTGRYTKIEDGDAMKYLLLHEPNPLQAPAIGFVSVLPRELGLDGYVDRNAQFDLCFRQPLNKALA